MRPFTFLSLFSALLFAAVATVAAIGQTRATLLRLGDARLGVIGPGLYFYNQDTPYTNGIISVGPGKYPISTGWNFALLYYRRHVWATKTWWTFGLP